MYSIKRFLVRIVYYYVFRNGEKCARKLGVRIGSGCKILDDPGKVFGSEPWLVTIGDKCELTNGVRMITHEGGLWVARSLCSELRNSDILKPIKLGNNVMVGNYSLIMPGVNIGDNVIIGGHAVVTHDLESNCIYAGVPAKKIGKIEDFIEKSKKSPYRFNVKDMPQEKKMRIVLEKVEEYKN